MGGACSMHVTMLNVCKILIRKFEEITLKTWADVGR
jgi:hypothetical protein